MYKPRASHTEAHLRESFSLQGAPRPSLSRATIPYLPYNNYDNFNNYNNILPSRESVASDQIISHTHPHTHTIPHPHTHTRMDATSSGKRLRDDSMSTDSPVPPSKKYKQATSVGSSDSSSSNTSYGRLVDFDFQTMLRLDTPQPLFKDVKYDEPPARSESPTPPSPKSR